MELLNTSLQTWLQMNLDAHNHAIMMRTALQHHFQLVNLPVFIIHMNNQLLQVVLVQIGNAI